MSRADEYRRIYNEIEALFKKKLGIVKHEKMVAMIDELIAKHDRVVYQYRTELDQHRQLRNAIFHQSTDKAIAEPNQETLDSFRSLLEKLKSPQTAIDICTKPVKKFQTSDLIKNAIQQMAENTLTNVPVYNDEKLAGILSEQTYVKWLAAGYTEDGFIKTDSKVADIVDYLDPINGNNDNEYRFVKPNTDVFTIQDMFEDALKRGKRLSAIFVTNSGKQTEGLLGIITAWDLSRIKK